MRDTNQQQPLEVELPAWLPWIVLLLVSALLVASFVTIYTPAYMSNDGSQYIRTAKYIAAGQGVKTDILYFDPHYESGELPTAQTIWPPGFSYLIALISSLGVSLSTSSFIVCMASLIGASWLVYGILMTSGLSRGLALLVALASLAFTRIWSYPLVAASEAPFIFLTLFSVYFVALGVRSDRGIVYWLLAGLCAGAAFSVRYTGLFFLAAMGAWLLKEWLVGPRALAWRRGVAFSLIPLLAVAGIFLRNYLEVGSPTSRSGSDAGMPVLEALVKFRWPLGDVLGYVPEGLFASTHAQIGMALLILLCGISALCLRSGVAQGLKYAGPHAVFQVSLLYIGVSFAYMFYLTVGTEPGYVGGRYLTPLMPFALICTAMIFGRVFPVRSRLAASLLVAALALYLLGQLNNVVRRPDLLFSATQIGSYLRVPFAPHGTLLQYVQEQTGDGVVFSNEPQMLSYYLDRGALGPPDIAEFTHRSFDAAHVARLVAQYPVKLVVFFPKPPLARPPEDPDGPEFFRDLAEGRFPDWMTPEYRDGAVQIYSVNPGQLP